MTEEEFEKRLKRLTENMRIFRALRDRDQKRYLRGLIRSEIIDLTRI